MKTLMRGDSHANGEARRLQALPNCDVFGAPPEQGYDDIVFLASIVCDTPIALISMFDSEREWFKARIGMEAAEIPVAYSFCRHFVARPDSLFIVPDTRADNRFAGNPWVMSEPYIRSYAGAPLITRNGHAIGTLCVMDHEPRGWTDTQKRALIALAGQALAHAEIDSRVAALQERELRFRTFMDNSPVLATIKDENGRYIYANRPFILRCGMQMSEILGKTDFELWSEDVARRIRQTELAVMDDGQPVSEIEISVAPDGQKSYWQMTRFVLEGRRRLVGGIGLDITKAKRYEQQLMQYQEELKTTLERLEVLSVTDSLTELYNRRAFEDRLMEEFERARRYNLPLSLLLIDVDNFKVFNDTMGHTDGDELLHAIAIMLKENARANDVTARYGGDEFAVILPNTDSKVAFNLAERLRWTARELYWSSFQVTLSIGVAALSPDMKDRSELVIAADRALYDAKRRGRDQVSRKV